ncbi:MAG: polysaccharide deacetylase family protein [Actinobacteria bacterium]|nr:polysaccharide deacetylase family protein [Actinomycetota bacterium]
MGITHRGIPGGRHHGLREAAGSRRGGDGGTLHHHPVGCHERSGRPGSRAGELGPPATAVPRGPVRLVRAGPHVHYSGVPADSTPSWRRRDPQGRRPPPRRRRRQSRRVPPLVIAIIAIALVVGIIALATRGGDEPTAAQSTTEPVIPRVSEADIAAAAQQLGPRDQELVNIGQSGVSINRAGGGRKYVALTFDDGPGPDTPAVLAELGKLGVPATFFVLGARVQENPAVFRQVVAAGHEVGVHTWDHKDMTTLKPAQQKAEIETTAGKILSVGGVASRLFRAPYGSVDLSVLKQAEDARLLSVLWDVDTVDWMRPTPDQIVHSAVSQARPGSIILMHDGGGDRASTIAALARIVKDLRAKGYEFATVGDLVISDPPGSDDMSSESRSTQR